MDPRSASPILPSSPTFRNTKSGFIEIIYGPMFSGKTTEMYRRIRRHSLAKKNCLVIKYRKDTRYSEEMLSTHDRVMMEAVSCSVLSEVLNVVQHVNVIGIDEGQFYPDLIDFCESMANQGKIVIVSALDGTFERKPFRNVLELIPKAESVVKLNAVCMLCGGVASFSKRLVDSTAVELIGGAETYAPVCRKCFLAGDRLPTQDVAEANPSKVISPTIENPDSILVDS
jgi:thymidine kinase